MNTSIPSDLLLIIMFIKVRPMNGGSEAILNVSKLTKVEELRLLVEEKFSISPSKQRLFFHGKQVISFGLLSSLSIVL